MIFMLNKNMNNENNISTLMEDRIFEYALLRSKL